MTAWWVSVTTLGAFSAAAMTLLLRAGGLS